MTDSSLKRQFFLVTITITNNIRLTCVCIHFEIQGFFNAMPQALSIDEINTLNRVKLKIVFEKGATFYYSHRCRICHVRISHILIHQIRAVPKH